MHSYETRLLPWQGLVIEVRYCPDWSASYRAGYGHAMAHLKVDSGGIALPFTSTGYRSVFERAEHIEADGGPLAYVLDWLNQAARSPEWEAQEAAARQLSLFCSTKANSGNASRGFPDHGRGVLGLVATKSIA
jgi:hypothetical protein